MKTTKEHVEAYEAAERINFQKLLDFFATTTKKVLEYYVEPVGSYSSNDGWITFQGSLGTPRKALVELKTRYSCVMESYNDSPLTYSKLRGLRRKFSTGEYDDVLHVQFFEDGFIINDITWMMPSEVELEWKEYNVRDTHSDMNSQSRPEDKIVLRHPCGMNRGHRFMKVRY